MPPRPAALLASAVLLAAGCAPSPGSYKDELVAADKALSARAAKEGPKAAILATMASDAKLLDQYHPGAQGVRESFLAEPDDVQLTWEPAFVDASALGDLGYTWGRYLKVHPKSGARRAAYMERGYYVNIWRREVGHWRLVFTGAARDTH